MQRPSDTTEDTKQTGLVWFYTSGIALHFRYQMNWKQFEKLMCNLNDVYIPPPYTKEPFATEMGYFQYQNGAQDGMSVFLERVNWCWRFTDETIKTPFRLRGYSNREGPRTLLVTLSFTEEIYHRFRTAPPFTAKDSWKLNHYTLYRSIFMRTIQQLTLKGTVVTMINLLDTWPARAALYEQIEREVPGFFYRPGGKYYEAAKRDFEDAFVTQR